MRILRPHEVTTFPEFRELTPEELKEVYAAARAAFTAEDLQKYTEIYDEEYLAEDVIAEMEKTTGSSREKTMSRQSPNGSGRFRVSMSGLIREALLSPPGRRTESSACTGSSRSCEHRRPAKAGTPTTAVNPARPWIVSATVLRYT